MKWSAKDTVATGLVAAVVLIYVAYLEFDGIPLAHPGRVDPDLVSSGR